MQCRREESFNKVLLRMMKTKCIRMFGIVVLAWNLIVADCAYINRRQFAHDGISEDNNDNFDTSRYKFAYGVEDHKTGDFKMHQEERDGDLVKGEYTVGEADGTFRTVRYTADNLNGFHAVISKGGEARSQQQVPALGYHRSMKAPPTSTPKHRADREGARLAETTVAHLPIKKYTRELPQFAKNHAAKHSRVVESFAADNAEHYQSVDIGNNAERTHYEYNLSRDQLLDGEKLKEERAKSARHLEVYGQQPVFHLQVPQGFKKNEESMMPVALPLISHPVREDVNEDDSRERHGHGHGQGQEHAAFSDENEWKQIGQGRNEQANNYRQIFETHFGKFRRPSRDSDQGAFSYMNFEGESKSGYELQHGVKNSPRNKILPRY